MQRTMKRVVVAVLFGLTLAFGVVGSQAAPQPAIVAEDPGGGHGGTGG